jgi:hypothetical protein
MLHGKTPLSEGVSGLFRSPFLYQERRRMLNLGPAERAANRVWAHATLLDQRSLSSVFPYSIYKKISLPGWTMAIGKTHEAEPTKISFFVGWLSAVSPPRCDQSAGLLIKNRTISLHFPREIVLLDRWTAIRQSGGSEGGRASGSLFSLA